MHPRFGIILHAVQVYSWTTLDSSSCYKQWLLVKSKNTAHKLLLQLAQIFICGNLWKNRCACMYGGKTTNISRVKYAVYKEIFKMLNSAFPHLQCPAKWTYLLQNSERFIHDTTVNTVTCIKPQDEWIMINTNGSAFTNQGKLGAGGILRDKEGKMVMVFITPL